MNPAEKVLYGVGYLGSSAVLVVATVAVREALFLWKLHHRIIDRVIKEIP